MLVSVIITNHNYGAFLADAIDSALRQSHADLEVIVVDDGSSDESRDVLARYAGRVQCVLRQHAGQMASTNAGFAQSRGDVVILLDADDVLFLDTVARHVAALEDPEVVKSQGYLQIVDGRGEPGPGRVPVLLSPGGDYRRRFLSHGPFAYQAAFTSGSAWRRAVLDALMPLPERRHGFVGPDGYLAAVDAMFGRIAVVPGFVGRYRVHGSNSGPIGYRFDPAYMRDRVRGFERRVAFAAHHARAAGLDIDADRWLTRAGWKLTLSRHLLSLWGDGERAVGVRELCLSPFSPERSVPLAAARAAQLAFLRLLPDGLALSLAKRMMDGARSRRLNGSAAPVTRISQEAG